MGVSGATYENETVEVEYQRVDFVPDFSRKVKEWEGLWLNAEASTSSRFVVGLDDLKFGLVFSRSTRRVDCLRHYGLKAARPIV